MKTRALVVLAVLVALTQATPSLADPKAFGLGRRPGLDGPFSARHLTAAYNGLSVFAGPGQTPLFGQTYRENSPDAGFALEGKSVLGTPNVYAPEQAWARVGVAFGLGSHFEAGALFLSLRAAPDFALGDFPVYITYHWSFGNLDLGARFSFLTPAETGVWSLNPGMPLLWRLGKWRVDSGIFVNADLATDPTLGFHVPARVSYNITPRLFAAGISAFHEGAFSLPADTSIALGALLGYTTVWGARVVDFTAQSVWDSLFLLDASPTSNQVQPAFYRVQFGVTIHQLVM